MILPRPLKKWIAIFRGDVAPLLILLSVLLGFWFGLTPGWYGLHALVLVLALVINTHIGLFLLAAAIGRGLAYAGAPVLYHTGRAADGALGGLLDVLGGLPIVGLTDFSRYAVVGALVLGPLIGLAGGAVLAQAVTRFRRGWLTLEENSEKFKTFRENKWVRTLDWLLLGKSAKDVRATLERTPRLVRIPGIVVAAVVLLLAVGGLYFSQGEVVRVAAERALTSANGAEANVGQSNSQLLAGRVALEDVQLTDPNAPAQNRVQVATVAADASLWDALRGRIVLDSVELSDVRLDQPRATPGAVVMPAGAAETTPAEQERAVQRVAGGVDLATFSDAATYFENAQRMREMFAEAQAYLPSGDGPPPAPPEEPPASYLAHLTARAPRSPTPRLIVRQVTLEQAQTQNAFIGVADLTAENVSDAPVAAGLPLRVSLNSTERTFELTFTSDYGATPVATTVNGVFSDFPLDELQRLLSPENPVALQDGVATGTINGTASAEVIDLAIAVETQGLRATSRGELFGLDPRLTQQALDAVGDLTLTLRLVGPTQAPKLVFDEEAIIEALGQSVVEAGTAEAMRQVENLVGDQLPEDVPVDDETIEKSTEALKRGLGGLLGGGDDKEE